MGAVLADAHVARLVADDAAVAAHVRLHGDSLDSFAPSERHPKKRLGRPLSMFYVAVVI